MADQEKLRELRKILSERDNLCFYSGDVASGQEIDESDYIVIVGDVHDGAEIHSTFGTVFVIGNVQPGARIRAEDAIVVTGSGKAGELKSSFTDADVAIVIGKMYTNSTLILGHDDPAGREAIQDVIDWVETNYPKRAPQRAPRSTARKILLGTTIVAGATLAALGVSGLKEIFDAASAGAAVSTVFDACVEHPIRAFFGGAAGFIVADRGRPALQAPDPPRKV